jgi:hypothetical protein
MTRRRHGVEERRQWSECTHAVERQGREANGNFASSYMVQGIRLYVARSGWWA